MLVNYDNMEVLEENEKGNDTQDRKLAGMQQQYSIDNMRRDYDGSVS